MARHDGSKLKALYRRQDAELAELEVTLEELRVKYDHWMLGLEKREPSQQRLVVERAFRRSELDAANRAEVRFRFGGLRQRLATYGAYWDRVSRQMEEGTFRREGVLRTPRGPAIQPRRIDDAVDHSEEALPAPARPKSDAAAAADELLAALDASLVAAADAVGARRATEHPPAARPAPAPEAPAAPPAASASELPPQPPPAARPPGPPPLPRRAVPPPPPLPVARASSPPPVRPLESLYDEYVRAKRDNGESTERLSYDAFARSVEKKVQPGGTLSVAKREGRVTLVLRREGPR